MGATNKVRGTDHICYQCHMELQGSPRGRPENQGRKSYEVRDKLLSPIEIRCARCHRRLSRNEKYFDSSIAPIGQALGLAFWGCEKAYTGVKDAVRSMKGKKQNYQIDEEAEFEPSIYPAQTYEQSREVPPNYEEATAESTKQ